MREWRASGQESSNLDVLMLTSEQRDVRGSLVRARLLGAPGTPPPQTMSLASAGPSRGRDGPQRKTRAA
jgi:hypothetical protein